MSDLRDMNAECEHGYWGVHELDRYAGESQGWCPGGRNITIDYEAARRIVDETEIWGPRNRERLARRIVDAAVGDLE